MKLLSSHQRENQKTREAAYEEFIVKIIDPNRIVLARSRQA